MAILSPAGPILGSSLPPTRGDFVCDWVEEFCRLGTGDYYGQPYVLRDWQQRFIYQLYELTTDGRRRYRSATLGLPRGNGKTALIAALGVFELCSGYRESPLVSVCAASFEQASLIFDDMKGICASSPILAANTHVFDTEILLKDKPGRAYRVAAVAGTNEGQRPTAALFDEVHAFNTTARRRAHLILTNGVAKRRDAFSLNISTAGWDKESLLGEMYDKGERVNAGDLDDPTHLHVWYRGNPGLTPKTREEWTAEIEACNPAAGDFLDTPSVVSRCMEIPRHEADRYHRNLWTEAEEIWEVAQLWDDLQSPLELDKSKPLTVGIDIGLKHDTTAVVMAQNIEGRIVLRARVWENPYPSGSVQHDKWILNLGEVKAFLLDLWREYPVAARERIHGPAFFFDPFFFIESAQDLQAEKLNMIEYPQRPERMIAASQGFFDLAKAGIITHDGDETLRRHMRNVTAEQSPRGWRITKPKGSTKHIDAAIASAIAAFECSRVEPALPAPGIRIIEAGE